MGIVDFFGRTVNRYYRDKPAFTRRFLRAGYGAQQLLLKWRPNPDFLPSQAYLTRVSMRYTRLPLAHPERSALVNLFMPCELLHAMGVYPQCAEGFSSYLTGGKSERGFLDFAEEKGVPETCCSYHKALLGAVYAGLVQKPRFIMTTSTVCDANTNTFRAIAGHFGMPLHYIDVPMEESDAAVQYVEEQLQQLVFAMGDELGRKMDPQRLGEAVRRTNESVRHFNGFLQELETNYYPSSSALEMFRIITSHILMGTKEAAAFYRMQHEDATRCRPGGAKRILWSHVLPYYAEPLKRVFDFNPNYQLLLSDMNFDAMVELDEDRPLRSMARRLIGNHFNGRFGRKCESVVNMAQRLRADGAVLFCHFGCKQSNGGVFLLRDALQDAGVPVLVMDGDACDRRNMSMGQAETRLQAFLEVLEAK